MATSLKTRLFYQTLIFLAHNFGYGLFYVQKMTIAVPVNDREKELSDALKLAQKAARYLSAFLAKKENEDDLS